MSVLLHLSDTHFGTEQPVVLDALERLVREQPPTLAVLSGDVTQRATRPQFAAARAWMDRLAIPQWAVVPGNHDIPLFDLRARLFDPYGRHRAAMGHELEPVVHTPDFLVLTHNTTRWYRHENGEVSAQQIERTAQALETARRAAPRQVRVVVVHQPVAVTRDADESNILRGAEAAIGRWSDAGADIVLGGHIHLPFVLPLHEARTLPHPLWAVQAGTAVSSRVRPGAPNSVNLLHSECADGIRRCRVERWNYSAPAQRFVLAQSDGLDLAVPATGPVSRITVNGRRCY
ncbi:metallophosphoesterase [Xylophilus sp. Leaf220]|uniref:metallophosphoesterase family protein n=1 Tax=Xylophilus sp. Leaf220 TaxID=1735686 RepID=UPI0006FE96CA|nr:metallophosphoesterase [Xylophilus sp. Leaf220]KQM68495.1 DNA repair exonuclease [Xylophilus sp. Leaf220]